MKPKNTICLWFDTGATVAFTVVGIPFTQDFLDLLRAFRRELVLDQFKTLLGEMRVKREHPCH
jgi:hypothetical protein